MARSEGRISSAGGSAHPGIAGGSTSQQHFLDALSQYIEPDEALAAASNLLKDTNEEYTSKILERFMPKYIRIPAGAYLVGSKTPKPPEQPQRRVSLLSFYLGQLPITNDMFDLFVRETGYETEAEKAGYGTVFSGMCSKKINTVLGAATLSLAPGTSMRSVKGADWRHPSGPGSTIAGKHNHPVVQVSRHDAIAFAAWAGKRLPTEEEWEAAARGGDDRLFPWGNMWSDGHANLESSCIGDTTPVDQFRTKSVSPFGHLDQIGNIFEWTATLYEENVPLSRKKGYILKGGCWTSRNTIAISHRLIARGKYWSNTIGFRCAVSAT